MSETFSTPSALREFALETAAQLRAGGLVEAAGRLEEAANDVSSSGWEWLGELGAAATKIKDGFELPAPIAARLKRIRKTATARKPYG